MLWVHIYIYIQIYYNCVYMFTHIKTLPRGSSAFLSLPRVAVSKELECYRRSLYIHKFIYTHIYTYIHLDPLKQENAQGKINKPQKQGEHPYGAAHRCLFAPLRFSFIHLWPVDVTQKPEKKKKKNPEKKTCRRQNIRMLHHL